MGNGEPSDNNNNQEIHNKIPENYYQELMNLGYDSKEIFQIFLKDIKDCIERKDTARANIFLSFIRKQFPEIIIDMSYTEKTKKIEFLSETGIPFFYCISDRATFLKLNRQCWKC